MTIAALNITYGDVGLVYVNATEGVYDVDVKIFKDGDLINASFEVLKNNHAFTVYLNNLNAGSYLITITSVNFRQFETAEESLRFSVGKTTSFIEVYSRNLTYSENITIPCSVVNSSDVLVEVFDENYEKVSLNYTFNGSEIILNNIDVGVYTLLLSTAEDSNHFQYSTNITLNIKKASSKINITYSDFTYGDLIILNTTLINLTGIDLKLNSENVNYTYLNNQIMLFNVSAGTHTLEITALSDKNHNSQYINLTLIIKKAQSYINASDINVAYGESVKIKTTLINASDITTRLFKDFEITHNYTYENGEITIPQLQSGEYILEITTLTDANHESTSRNITLTVNKATSLIIVNNTDFTYGDLITIPVDLINASDYTFKIFKNATEIPVNFTKNSVLQLNQLDAGVYILHFTGIVDENHLESSKNITLTVKPSYETKSGTISTETMPLLVYCIKVITWRRPPNESRG